MDEIQDPFANTQETPTRSAVWKPVLIVAAGITLIVGVVWLVTAVVSRHSSGSIDSERLNAVLSQTSLETQVCEGALDPEACRRARVASRAGATGLVEVCRLLEGSDYDSCVLALAGESGSVELCQEIEAEGRRLRCVDALRLHTAISTQDADVCKKINNEDRRASCLSLLAHEALVVRCADLQVQDQACDLVRLIEKARLAQDPDICETIEDESARADCQDQVGIGDRDFDGLDSDEEDYYGSSDRLVDSDGDGFSDDEEVQNGYNPAGEGRLE